MAELHRFHNDNYNTEVARMQECVHSFHDTQSCRTVTVVHAEQFAHMFAIANPKLVICMVSLVITSHSSRDRCVSGFIYAGEAPKMSQYLHQITPG